MTVVLTDIPQTQGLSVGGGAASKEGGGVIWVPTVKRPVRTGLISNTYITIDHQQIVSRGTCCL